MTTTPGRELLDVRVGQSFVLRLPSWTVAGYAWSFDYPPALQALDALDRRVDQGEVRGGGGGAPGASGWETHAFRVLRPGRHAIKAVLRQPWDKVVEQTRQFLIVAF